MNEPQANPVAASGHRRNRLVVRVFGVIGTVAEGPAAITALVFVILIVAALIV